MALFVVVAVIGGCGGSEEADLEDRVEELERRAAAATSQPQPTTALATTTSVIGLTSTVAPGLSTTTTRAATPADKSAEALAFFKGTEAACKGEPPLDPKRFAAATVTGRRPGDSYLIRDGLGTTLIVDLTRRIVTGTAGAEAPMPRAYSFACPPELYQGTFDE